MEEEIFKGVYIHPTAEVDESSRILRGTSIWNQAQIREKSIIGALCNIGKDVYIDAEVKIGNNVKIQNGVSVYRGVELENDVFVGPHVVFTNDLFPRAWIGDFKIHRTLVKKGASIGANATIVCGITIGQYSMIGAGSNVTRDIPPHALVLGNPAKTVGFVSKDGQKLDIIVEKSNGSVLLKSSVTNEEQSIPEDIYNGISD